MISTTAKILQMLTKFNYDMFLYWFWLTKYIILSYTFIKQNKTPLAISLNMQATT
jgi:hypothetical protein